MHEPHASQIEAFFEQHVQPRLAPLEALRRRARMAIAALVVVTLAVIVTANITDFLPQGAWIALGIVLFIVFGIVAAAAYVKFNEAYKSTIVGPLMKNLDPGVVYEPDGKIPEERVQAACFLPEADTYMCEDVVRGQTNGAPFEFANIQLKTGSGKKSRTIFHGLFFQMADARPRRGTTVVIPWDWEPQIPDVDDPPKIPFEDEQINETFEAFSTDPAEGAQILSPRVMATFVKLAESLDTDVFGSFTPGKVSVAAKVGDFFEPGLTGKLVSREDVTRIATLFTTARRIATDLSAADGGHFAHAFVPTGRQDEPVHAHASATTFEASTFAAPSAFGAPLSDAPSLQPIVERLRGQGIGVSLLGQSSLTLDYGVRGKMWFSLGVTALWTLLGLSVHDRATGWPAGGELARPLIDVLPLAQVALDWLAGFHPWTSWGLLALGPLGLFNAQRRFLRRVVLTPQAVERVGGLLPGAGTRAVQPGGTVTVRDGIVFVKSASLLGVGVSPPLSATMAEDVAKLVAGFRGVPGPA